MTKKDYEAIAHAVYCEKEVSNNARWSTENTTFYRVGVYMLAQRIADIMERDNPRFDRGRFMRACGFD